MILLIVVAYILIGLVVATAMYADLADYLRPTTPVPNDYLAAFIIALGLGTVWPITIVGLGLGAAIHHDRKEHR